MKRNCRAFGAFVTVILLAGTAAARAGEAHLYFAPQAWFAHLSGDSASAKGAANEFDVADDLAADDVDVHPGLDFLARIGHHRIVGGYGSGKVNGDKLDSSVTLSRRRIFYGYSFINAGMLDITGLIGGDGYNVKTKATGFKPANLDSPAPAIGLSIGIRPPVVPLRFYAEVVRSSLKVSGVDTKLTDVSVSIDWYLIPVFKIFGLQAGYRSYDLHSEDTDTGEKSNYTCRGPFAGLVFRF